MQTNKEVRVGIADAAIVSAPDTLITMGLGSCIGIALYDNVSKVAGLAHIMLPYSKDFKNNTNVMKFADTCIPLLLEKMEEKGAKRRNISARIAGGANMFKMEGETIGTKNAIAVEEVLHSLKIPIKGKDCGGSIGRTIRIEAEFGNVYVRKVGSKEELKK